MSLSGMICSSWHECQGHASLSVTMGGVTMETGSVTIVIVTSVV